MGLKFLTCCTGIVIALKTGAGPTARPEPNSRHLGVAMSAQGKPDMLGHAQEQIDRTMNSMRDNMAMLQERDASLSQLQDKSSVLQGTSGAFNRQARQLQLEMKWRQYKIALLVAVILIWCVCFFIFKDHLKMFLPISAGA